MILCSRARCGCLASSLLSGDSPNGELTDKDIAEFSINELKEDHVIAYENRLYVFCERCPQHEKEFAAAHADYQQKTPEQIEEMKWKRD